MKSSDIIAAIAAQPVLAGVSVLTGSDFRFQEDSPGRIVFVPAGAKYEPAERHKGMNPRAVRTRVARFDAFCWGADLDATETLLNNLCAAIHLTTGDYALIGDSVLAQDGEDLSNFGIVHVLHVEFRVPVTLPADTTVAVAEPSVAGTSVQLVPQDVGMTFADSTTVSGTPAP